MTFRSVRSQPAPEVMLLELQGTLDASVQDQLEDALREAIRSAEKGLLISLQKVDFLDSSGLGALLRSWGEAETEGLRFALVLVPPKLLKLLDTLGILSRIPFYPTVSDALKEWETEKEREWDEEVVERERGAGIALQPPPTREAAQLWTMEIHLGCDPKLISVARLACAGFASQLGLGLDEIEDIKLAVSEACTNVLQHAYEEPHGRFFLVRCRVEGDGLVLEVVDEGRGLPPERPTNLGTMIMTSVMDEVHFLSGDKGGTIVRMIKKLRFSQ
ncbi:MAG: anti-sigma factor antagonist [Armatimonadetes bacterium]|nr:anti-sigma factor antagonist [Armatimonadota bacterium]MDW8122536.1 anti-sigma factor antagonist [Armatimonadota bacterium]